MTVTFFHRLSYAAFRTDITTWYPNDTPCNPSRTAEATKPLASELMIRLNVCSHTIRIPFLLDHKTMSFGSPLNEKHTARQRADSAAILHALFPTLVYQTKLTDANRWNSLLLTSLPDHNFSNHAEQRGQHFAGEYHGQSLLHLDDRLAHFFATLAIQVADYLKVLGMQPELFDLQCLKSWFVICHPANESDVTTDSNTQPTALLPHNHSCSDISWVYYVDVPADCPAITFHSGRTLPTEPFGSAFHYDWQHDHKSSVTTFNQWNKDTWSIIPKTGDLLLFPGHQLHSVEANHTDQRRISVAGDLALTLKPEYIDREFGRTAPENWKKLPLK